MRQKSNIPTIIEVYTGSGSPHGMCDSGQLTVANIIEIDGKKTPYLKKGENFILGYWPFDCSWDKLITARMKRHIIRMAQLYAMIHRVGVQVVYHGKYNQEVALITPRGSICNPQPLKWPKN